MIISYLMGGLGNQMFQYAAGRSLAIRLNVELKLDVSRYVPAGGLTTVLKKKVKQCLGIDHRNGRGKGAAKTAPDTPREYALNGFNLEETFATPREIYRISGIPGTFQLRMGHAASRVTRKGSVILGLPVCPPAEKFRIFREERTEFQSEFVQLPDNTYLLGYWQSEQYFSSIEEIIRSEFTFKEPLAGRNRDLADKIEKCESVSLHVRRGDYISHPIVRQVHGVCTQEYYMEAIKEVTKSVSRPHFFVFSDDPQWVQEHLLIDYPVTYVTHNSVGDASEDLRLMSLCRHNIIANSSFSWWGAWLNENREKIVITPRVWFLESYRQNRDLLPAKWKKLDIPLGIASDAG